VSVLGVFDALAGSLVWADKDVDKLRKTAIANAVLSDKFRTLKLLAKPDFLLRVQCEAIIH
jgi:hypothetical protein